MSIPLAKVVEIMYYYVVMDPTLKTQNAKLSATDADIIVKATQGSENAKIELFKRHAKQIYFICVSLRGYLPDSADICADIFADMYRDLPELEKILDFRRGFYSAAVSYCVKRTLETPVRKSRSVETALADLADKASAALDRGLTNDHEILKYQMLGAIIDYMPVKQAAALLYFDFAGGSAESAADYPFLDAENLTEHRQAAEDFINRRTAFLKSRNVDITDITADLPAALDRLAEDTLVPAAAYTLTAEKTGVRLRPPKHEAIPAPSKSKPDGKSVDKTAKITKRDIVIVIAVILAIALILAAVGALRGKRSDKKAESGNEKANAVVYWDGEVASGFASGEGTADSPYVITTGAELAYLSQQVAAGNATVSAANYILGTNIALNTTAKYSDWDKNPPEHAWTPIDPFNGVFDGNGHTISGVYVNNVDCGGLFGQINNATVKDLNVESSYIRAATEAGGIIADAHFDAELPVVIEGLSFSGEVISENGHAGGIVGFFGDGGVLTRCSSRGNVTAAKVAGGIVGVAGSKTDRFSINNSYSRCEVAGGFTAGGIAGSNVAKISAENSLILKCYNAGRVFITADKGQSGAICGNNSGKVQNCYYLENTADTGSVDIGNGTSEAIVLTENEMMQDKYFEGFDFADFWEFAGKNGYKFPTLRQE